MGYFFAQGVTMFEKIRKWLDFGFVKTKEPTLLPDESPVWWKLVFFAFQQFVVMFPATILVALLTGFHVSTTLFASGIASLGFIFATQGKIPLYYGSSFSYIAAVASITGVQQFGAIAPDALIGQAQFGIILSGLVSIFAGFLVNKFGKDKVDIVLPAEVTGSVAMVIGISLMGVALTGMAGNWLVGLVTLLVTIFASVFFKGFLGQLPILFGMIAGYLVALFTGNVDFAKVATAAIVQAPHFTFPIISWAAVAAIMPIAIATIPESTTHLYQIDLYVNKLSKDKGGKEYDIKKRLGKNLMGDGLGDMISAFFGGPAGTNYGENISAMAITKVFSVPVLIATAILAMAVSFLGQFSALINTIPGAVIGGLSVYLFGVIVVQGLGLMIDRKVDIFNNKVVAIIATTLVIGAGGSFAFPYGMIPIFGLKLPAIATAAVWGIVLNLILNFFDKKKVE
jgi:uracil permease